MIPNIWKRIGTIGSKNNKYSKIELEILNYSFFWGFVMMIPTSIVIKILFPNTNHYITLIIFNLLFLIGYIFNYFGKYNLSRLYIILLSQSIACWGASVLGESANLQYISFILIIASMVHFNSSKIIYKIAGMLIPVIGLLLLYLMDFKLVSEPLNIDNSVLKDIRNFIIIITLVPYIMNVYFFQKLVNEQKKTIKKRNEELESKILEINKLNTNLDKFVSIVSHDLRSPLASAISLIKVSKNEDDINVLKEYLEIQDRSLNRMNDFINSILNYYRNSKTDNYVDSIDIEWMIDEIFESNEMTLKMKNIQKEIQVNQSGKFRNNPIKVNLILSNIISNAIHYYDSSKENHIIKVKCNSDSKKAIFEIWDNGIGISEKNIEKIFEMFYRGENSQSGSGLGLFMTQEMTAKLNGKIQVESALGQYTKFIVQIPNITD